MQHFNLPHFIFPLILSLFASFIIIDTDAEKLSLPGCPRKCGNLTIPFPFGMNPGCYFDDSFHITCSTSYEPPKPFLGRAQVAGISLDGKIRLLNSSLFLVVNRWAAGGAPCHVARNDASRYACRSPHSECRDSSSGRGHICRCLPGFHGNPYLVHGCQDIDECADSNHCKGVCINTVGSFKCYCTKRLVGDSRKGGIGCRPQDEIKPTSPFSYSPIGIILVVPLLVMTWIEWTSRQKKRQTYRDKQFEQNGGNKLFEKSRRKTEPTLYTDQEMRSIKNHVPVQGNRSFPGAFYRGMLPDKDGSKEVAVVMVETVPESQIGHFVDQLIFLSRPIEKNVIRIIGCCLEALPLSIVYEVHSDGGATLFDYICGKARFSCEMRVKAAAGIARGLAYLNSHKCSKKEFVLGNICSANILMDTSFDAKIFYVAGSNLIGPPGNDVYKDPVLIKSGSLNKKSDVYSFGVVLLELLIGRGADPKMVSDFVNSAKVPGRLHEILDKEMAGEGDSEVVTKMVELAEKCLKVEPKERPNIKKVKAKLSKLMQVMKRKKKKTEV